ncbi:PRTRC system protein C [Burkholderia cenocepacia]|uniref:PRTRC system protein C n=1 Tax=Burkholderia cenocepacia TaxID=95486 RepID=UPI001CF12576|nr:PRTRC system protein C [Burkholderia cenocepacia]MCA8082738.1 PRTRC system protein C [Burkholderia cenocepacia]
MQIETLAREFSYNGAKLADPAPTFTLQQIRDFYSQTYPELTNAEIEGPVIKGNRNVYTFRRAVGTKGTSEATRDISAMVDAIINGTARPPYPIFSYLLDVERFARAHACPLLDEEVAFINALHARYCPLPK